MHWRRAREVAAAFFDLGLTSFGGPIAHIGYFRHAFVERRRWLDDERFAQLLAICQFLPGPASSQLGFAIGMLRAGWLGALAAFVSFTLPSVAALLLFAQGLSALDTEPGRAALAGLKLVAIAVVAHGLVGMARSLCDTWLRRAMAAGSLAALLIWPGLGTQLAVVFAGVVLGLTARPAPGEPSKPLTPIDPGFGQKTALALLAAFGFLLLALPLLSGPHAALFEAFYRSGALVFGGGHVVLPLLENALVARGLLDQELFLAGYGAAQAVPGPLFSVAAFHGLFAEPVGGIAGAALGVTGIFLPGFLLVAAAMPLWNRLPKAAAAAVAGVNAAVVGLLAAALWNPLVTSGIRSGVDVAIALLATAGLLAGRLSPLSAVAGCVGLRVLAGLLT